MYHLSEDPELNGLILSWFENMINILAKEVDLPADILASALIEGERRRKRDERKQT